MSITKFKRPSPVNRGETLLPVDTGPLFRSIFLRPDAYGVGSRLSDRQRLRGFVLTENNWGNIKIMENRVD